MSFVFFSLRSCFHCLLVSTHVSNSMWPFFHHFGSWIRSQSDFEDLRTTRENQRPWNQRGAKFQIWIWISLDLAWSCMILHHYDSLWLIMHHYALLCHVFRLVLAVQAHVAPAAGFVGLRKRFRNLKWTKLNCCRSWNACCRWRFRHVTTCLLPTKRIKGNWCKS